MKPPMPNDPLLVAVGRQIASLRLLAMAYNLRQLKTGATKKPRKILNPLDRIMR